MDKANSCLFCSIINKKIPANIVAENKNCLAFFDINPVAETHILITPKIHMRSVNDLSEENSSIMADLFMMAVEIARQLNFDKRGYRLVINTEASAGQSVFHLHMHLLAGREFSWPPG